MEERKDGDGKAPQELLRGLQIFHLAREAW